MDAARYPVAAKVAELLTQGHVLFHATFYCIMLLFIFTSSAPYKIYS